MDFFGYIIKTVKTRVFNGQQGALEQAATCQTGEKSMGGLDFLLQLITHRPYQMLAEVQGDWFFIFWKADGYLSVFNLLRFRLLTVFLEAEGASRFPSFQYVLRQLTCSNVCFCEPMVMVAFRKLTVAVVGMVRFEGPSTTRTLDRFERKMFNIFEWGTAPCIQGFQWHTVRASTCFYIVRVLVFGSCF